MTTDHAEQLWRAAASYREAQRRAGQRSEELAAAVRAAFNDEPGRKLKKSEILKATGYVWTRTWVDKVLRDDDKPADRPVVLAIITSGRGVLVGKRTDGIPPWTFPGGEMRPGELPGATAVREVNEETGLVIEFAAFEIGRRVHPATGRSVIYLACNTANGLDVVADGDELAEAKWVSAAEAEHLMPDMFEVVRAYLRRELALIGDQ